MSKRNHNRPKTVITNPEVNTVENIEEEIVTPVEEVEEIQGEIPVETIEEKHAVEERVVEEVVETIPVPVVEEPVLQEEVVVEVPVEEISELVEKPEERFYVTLGLVPSHKLDVVKNRLDRAGFKPTILKNEEIIVGPFATETDAIFAKKAILRAGLRGKIINE